MQVESINVFLLQFISLKNFYFYQINKFLINLMNLSNYIANNKSKLDHVKCLFFIGFSF